MLTSETNSQFFLGSAEHFLLIFFIAILDWCGCCSFAPMAQNQFAPSFFFQRRNERQFWDSTWFAHQNLWWAKGVFAQLTIHIPWMISVIHTDFTQICPRHIYSLRIISFWGKKRRNQWNLFFLKIGQTTGLQLKTMPHSPPLIIRLQKKPNLAWTPDTDPKLIFSHRNERGFREWN